MRSLFVNNKFLSFGPSMAYSFCGRPISTGLLLSFSGLFSQCGINRHQSIDLMPWLSAMAQLPALWPNVLRRTIANALWLNLGGAPWLHG
jgi:hypothetical protein